MNKYRVIINGVTYEVEVEQITADAAVPTPTTATPAPSAGSQGEQILAPLPGSIFSIIVANGQTVKKGQVLMILEAMKMENEIMAPCDGTVGSIAVKTGDAIESGALLCILT